MKIRLKNCRLSLKKEIPTGAISFDPSECTRGTIQGANGNITYVTDCALVYPEIDMTNFEHLTINAKDIIVDGVTYTPRLRIVVHNESGSWWQAYGVPSNVKTWGDTFHKVEYSKSQNPTAPYVRINIGWLPEGEDTLPTPGNGEQRNHILRESAYFELTNEIQNV